MLNNFFDPAILFFLFGIGAGLLRSNLEIPPPISKFLSLYLLMALGLKGGFALSQSGLNVDVAKGLGAAVFLAIFIPTIGYQLLKRITSPFDAAAIAATYGSVSAVTFMTAVQFLDGNKIAYSGHMSAAMAMMESPAILLAVFWVNGIRKKISGTTHSHTLKQTLHESLTDGAQLLLLGAMLVGILSGEQGKTMMAPFSVDLFKGMLAFFLLDMGLTASRNFHYLKGKSLLLIAYAILGPIFHSLLALGLAYSLGMSLGDSVLLMVLASSASYIAVPAALKLAIPEASPSLYLGLSLGLTFPLNIILGIPLYSYLANWAI
ncbi:MAG: sodium-dependent bicarbonate transport family permease [Burkholderiales bacterium]|nr:sodium-dependent bicarbonate transport family permease [Burkholderiales bacterium]